MTITTEKLDPIEAALAAVPAGSENLVLFAIAAYLRAAAEDGELCGFVAVRADEFLAPSDMGRAAILALAEHVEAGR